VSGERTSHASQLSASWFELSLAVLLHLLQFGEDGVKGIDGIGIGFS
jgi:hypothetical protein